VAVACPRRRNQLSLSTFVALDAILNAALNCLVGKYGSGPLESDMLIGTAIVAFGTVMTELRLARAMALCCLLDCN